MYIKKKQYITHLDVPSNDYQCALDVPFCWVHGLLGTMLRMQLHIYEFTNKLTVNI